MPQSTQTARIRLTLTEIQTSVLLSALTRSEMPDTAMELAEMIEAQMPAAWDQRS